jgi:hypothetical protein
MWIGNRKSKTNEKKQNIISAKYRPCKLKEKLLTIGRRKRKRKDQFDLWNSKLTSKRPILVEDKRPETKRFGINKPFIKCELLPRDACWRPHTQNCQLHLTRLSGHAKVKLSLCPSPLLKREDNAPLHLYASRSRRVVPGEKAPTPHLRDWISYNWAGQIGEEKICCAAGNWRTTDRTPMNRLILFVSLP